MKLSIVVPVFNERKTLVEILRRVATTPYDKEIVVVDDGSSDGTTELLKSVVEDPSAFGLGGVPLRAFYHGENRGKGAALRTAFTQVRGDVVLIQDADLEYDPRDYATLLQPIAEGKADVVFSNRFHGGPHRVLYFWHYLGNRLVTMMANVTTNLNLSDIEAGYKAFRRDVLDRIQLRSRRFGCEPELTVKVAKLGCRVYEVPIAYHGRTYEEGKKITWKDGLVALYSLLRFRFRD